MSDSIQFHQKHGGSVQFTDAFTTASTDFSNSGFVFSSAPVQSLPCSRFVFKVNKIQKISSVWFIGVTTTDPSKEPIPKHCTYFPKTLCVKTRDSLSGLYMNGKYYKGLRNLYTSQQEGDMWCVEVTPAGQVCIYHNYGQPWGSPVFTLPPDKTKAWVVITLANSSISVLQATDHGTPSCVISVEFRKCLNQNLTSLRMSAGQSCHSDKPLPPLSISDWTEAVDVNTRVRGHTKCSPTFPRDQTSSLSYTCPYKSEKPPCELCETNFKIYCTAETVVLWVKTEITKVLKQKLTLGVIAIGSYISELKMLGNNELDFLLVLEGFQGNKYATYELAFQLYQDWFEHLSEYVKKFPFALNSVYPHGPAWCLEITWKKGGVVRWLSVDVTLAFRQPNLSMQRYCKSIAKHQYFSSVYETLNEKALFVNLCPTNQGYTNATAYLPLFARTNDVCPNALLVMRVVKVLIAILFPKRVTLSLHRTCGYSESSFISSHEITDCVLRYMDKHLHAGPEFWSRSSLPGRFIDILCILRLKAEPVGYLHDDRMNLELSMFDFLIGFFKGENIEHRAGLKHEFPCFAVIKLRKYKTISSKEELNMILRPNSQTLSNKRELLAYIIPDHYLLGPDSKKQPNQIRYFQTLTSYLKSQLNAEVSENSEPELNGMEQETLSRSNSFSEDVRGLFHVARNESRLDSNVEVVMNTSDQMVDDAEDIQVHRRTLSRSESFERAASQLSTA